MITFMDKIQITRYTRQTIIKRQGEGDRTSLDPRSGAGMTSGRRGRGKVRVNSDLTPLVPLSADREREIIIKIL